MIKTITFLKRRADLSPEEFKRQYETGHAVLGKEVLSGHCEYQVRRYLRPLDHALNEEGRHGIAAGFDCIMEMWFKDKAQYDSTMKLIGSAELAQRIIQSGYDIFDRSLHFTYVITEENKTDLPTTH